MKEHSTFNVQHSTLNRCSGRFHWMLNFECWLLNVFRPGLLAICIWMLVPQCLAESLTNKAPRIKVSGFGLLGDREMVRLLKNFQTKSNVLDRAFVEDSALVLFSRMHSLGYLASKLQAIFVESNGRKEQMTWTNALEVELPRDFAAREARFRARGGVRFYYEQLEITGIKAMTQKEAQSYFISGGVLL